jgi:hypothetical protein
VKLTDQLHENDKLGGVSDAAFRLWTLAISWSNLKLTDGHVPSSRPTRLMSMRKPDKTIGELVEAKLWHRASSPCASCVRQREDVKADPIPSGGYVIHHYFGDPKTQERYQKARWVVEAERTELRKRGREGGIKSGSARSGALKRAASEDEEGDEADGSSGALKRAGQAVRSSGALNHTAQAHGSSGALKPVPPYPRSPVSQSDSSRTNGGVGGVGDLDDPPIPDDPRAPGTARKSSQGRGTGLHRIAQGGWRG